MSELCRRMYDNEKFLVLKMLKYSRLHNKYSGDLSSWWVEPIGDLNMGGLRVRSKTPMSERRFAEWICEAQFYDEDGAEVSVALNVDQFDEIYEIDIWRLEEGDLKRIPEADLIRILPSKRLTT